MEVIWYLSLMIQISYRLISLDHILAGGEKERTPLFGFSLISFFEISHNLVTFLFTRWISLPWLLLFFGQREESSLLWISFSLSVEREISLPCLFLFFFVEREVFIF